MQGSHILGSGLYCTAHSRKPSVVPSPPAIVRCSRVSSLSSYLLPSEVMRNSLRVDRSMNAASASTAIACALAEPRRDLGLEAALVGVRMSSCVLELTSASRASMQMTILSTPSMERTEPQPPVTRRVNALASSAPISKLSKSSESDAQKRSSLPAHSLPSDRAMAAGQPEASDQAENAQSVVAVVLPTGVSTSTVAELSASTLWIRTIPSVDPLAC